jgi:hypothetical protein
MRIYPPATYPSSFPSLDPDVLDPVEQHITPFSLDRYRWRLKQAGLEFVQVTVDNFKTTVFSRPYHLAPEL